jgi:hypothetical protein
LRYFFDTEFIEDGPLRPITLISIGIVSEDGREFYVENSDAGHPSEWKEWLRLNVAPHLTGPKMPHKDIGPAILKFIGMDVKPEFWAYFADYDWVVFCQIFGSMISLPPTFPHLCMDLKQVMVMKGVSKPVVSGNGPEHNALADARWVKAVFKHIQENYP